MHKAAHTFQLPASSCLVDDGAVSALRTFLEAAVAASRLALKLTDVAPTNTPASRGTLPIHRITVVFEGEPAVVDQATALAARAVTMAAAMPAAEFVERLKVCTDLAKSTGRPFIGPAGAILDSLLTPPGVPFVMGAWTLGAPGVDLAASPDRTATVTLSIDPDGTRRVIEDPTAPGADPIDENETDL
jgi:hypothetical protein